ncbi:MAG: transaldolase family protein [Nitrospirota bacterium]
MKLFIDSANIKTIEKYSKMNIFSGVTTTPTFFRREGINDIPGEIEKIFKIISGEVHIEAMGNTSEDIIKSAMENKKMGTDVVSKIPLNYEGIKAVKYLSEHDIKTNVHLIFSLNQAILAALAGATYVCPLVGRIYDIGYDGFNVVEEIIAGFKKYPEIKSKVMVSSVRTPEHVRQAFLLGAEVATIPPFVIEQMFHHPLTKSGIDKFEEDIMLTRYVRDILHMGEDLPIVYEETNMKDAIVEMTRKKLGIVLVVDKDEKLIGCITDGDLRRAIQKFPDIYNHKAKDCMTKDPKTIQKDAFVQEALTIMEKLTITQLVITDENQKPFGIVHIHDILKI